MSELDMQALALAGAKARLNELDTERAQLTGLIAKLEGRKVTAKAGGMRKPMTAAERKAVSERMKKYWAARRNG